MHLKRFLLVGLSLCFAVSTWAAEGNFKVALVFDKGGKDDRSFNNAAYTGVMKAKAEHKLSIKYVEATDDNAYESLLRSLVQKNYQLIVAIGIAQADAVKKISVQFPKTHFAIVDAEVKGENVKSLLFEEHEGSYLVGAIAGMTSKTGKVGFIGGMDIPLIRRFEMGFEAGVKKVNPSAKVISNFIGVTGEAWNNPAKAKELAVSQYGAGADVVFAAAGASNGGLFDAAEEKKKFAIGVDSNQNWIKPGFILTSMLKRVDQAVYETCVEASQGKFAGGVRRFGLANQGVDYAIDQYNEKLIPEPVRQKVEQLKKDIIAGKIQVPDYYKKK